MPDQVLGVHHVSIIVTDTGKSVGFYREVLGFRVSEDRPALDFPGAWLRSGSVEIHLLEVPNPDPVEGRPAHGGRDRHMAFAVRDMEALKGRLERVPVAYTVSRSGRPAIFCRDPDGNGIELIQDGSRDRDCE